MGHNSNRPLNRGERIAKYAKKISEHRGSRDRDFSFETQVGAEIRGQMGIERGNQFIDAIRKANKL